MSKKEPYPQQDEVETRKGAQDIDVKAFETNKQGSKGSLIWLGYS